MTDFIRPVAMSAKGSASDTELIRAYYDQALKFKKAGDFDEAERICRRAAAIYQRDPNIMCLLGETLLKQDKPRQALDWFQKTLDLYPDYARALDGTGRAWLARKKYGLAVTALQQAAALVPDRYSTHLALGKALSMAGHREEANISISRALELNPEKAIVAEAASHWSEGRGQEAEEILRKHLAQRPDDPVALRLLGNIAMEGNRGRVAIRLLSKAVESAPDFLLARIDLATALLKRDRFEDALIAAEKAVLQEPELPLGWSVKASVLAKAQRYEEALEAYDKALELSPGHGAALAGKGHALKTIGQQAESIETYRECIRHHPAFGEAYWSLANLKTFRFEPEEVEVMEMMAANEDLKDEPRVNFHFSLGKHFDSNKEYDKAFEHYREGSDLRRPHESYDPVQTRVIHDHIIDLFDEEFFAEREGWGHSDNAPILIVGLPRSGSTLIEQILASHSQVEGTQELPDLSRCVGEINRHRKKDVGYPGALKLMNQEDIEHLANFYRESTQRYRTGKAYFIDKMPNNFPHVGLLQLMLPNARVINARRHPLDSCLGSFKQLFFNGQSFTYDFFELGQYYLEYQRIMDHWHKVLPGKVLDVHYEQVVFDLEGQTRRLLDYCGLPFEDQCLRFYETQRPVNTASSEQVRQPIYTGAVNYWRHYEHLLDELIYQLEPLLVELPAESRPESLQ